jgi:hypothetical protein
MYSYLPSYLAIPYMAQAYYLPPTESNTKKTKYSKRKKEGKARMEKNENKIVQVSTTTERARTITLWAQYCAVCNI